MEFHAHTSAGSVHVCTVHRGPKDETPLQMISAQELARLRRIEVDHQALLGSLPAAPQKAL